MSQLIWDTPEHRAEASALFLEHVRGWIVNRESANFVEGWTVQKHAADDGWGFVEWADLFEAPLQELLKDVQRKWPGCAPAVMESFGKPGVWESMLGPVEKLLEELVEAKDTTPNAALIRCALAAAEVLPAWWT